MKIALASFILLVWYYSVDAQGSTTDQGALDTAQRLYAALKNIAFPTKTNEDVTSTRFLLLMPGVPLSYSDYYPGSDYSNHILNPDAPMKEAVVPPHVMEKWFDLADVIPNPNPLNGQDTGFSLANIYGTILQEMKLKSLDSQDAKATYNQSVTYLTEVITDPAEPSSSVSRLSLYERYRDLYFTKKLDMDNKIEEMRKTTQALEYELWFQRNYPSLQAKVESAYTQWLIFGQKETVEVYLANMDMGSSVQMLEEARMALRAAGVTSLDRTRTIYPVTFEPADWYKYLLPADQKLSRDQLNNMLGKVNAKINIIEVMINTSRGPSSQSGSSKYNTLTEAIHYNLTMYLSSELQCLKGSDESCKTYESLRKYLIQDLVEEAGEFSNNQHIRSYQYDPSYIDALEAQKEQLQILAGAISGRLGTTAPYLGGLLNDPALEVDSFQDASDDQNNWLQFQFNSEEYDDQKHQASTHESVSAGGGLHFFFFSVSGSYSYQKDTSDFSEQLAQSKMRVKGEMLRINIKRPWFKAELFNSAEIYFQQSIDGEVRYVSPGQHMSETDFITKVTSSNNIGFMLPEYPTSFLLARNIEMEFDGIDSSVITSTMNEMSQASGHGGFLFFHASASVSKSKTTSSVNIQRTANGMKLSIPGTQMIGYYTSVLPKFPHDQKLR